MSRHRVSVVESDIRVVPPLDLTSFAQRMPENVIVINAEGPETRVGVLENGRLAEYFMERKRHRGTVGGIYRAKVRRVLPGMQAAFLDLGPTVERAAFMHVGDIVGGGDDKQLFELEREAPADGGAGRTRSRKVDSDRKIQDLLKPQQNLIVQIVKDPIGQKGARVTGFVSLPGRYGVLLPAVDHVGISRRIGTDKTRRRLREVVNSVRPKGTGFIVRTAAETAQDDEVRDDISYLIRLWEQIGAREQKLKGPGVLYADLDLVLRSLRDLLREDTKEIVIDSEEQFDRAVKFVNAFLPRYVERITHYTGRKPIFDHFPVESALKTAVGRHVPLESGGHLVIDQSEALTAIDVNTGSFVGSREEGLESTVTKNNLEASQEIARQLRLRNIGGIIVADFVDMEKEENRLHVWEVFNNALSADRARCNVTRISELGLVEMTRKRTRESLIQLLTEPCPTCDGSAVVKSTETVANEVLREVRRLGNSVQANRIQVEAPVAVIEYLQTNERTYMDELEKKFQKLIDLKADPNLKPDVYRVAGRASDDEPPARKKTARKPAAKSKRKPAAKKPTTRKPRAAPKG